MLSFVHQKEWEYELVSIKGRYSRNYALDDEGGSF
jgi:hypothetical protein